MYILKIPQNVSALLSHVSRPIKRISYYDFHWIEELL